MKKFLFLVVFLFLEFRFSGLVFGIDPVNISKSEKAYPPSLGSDQNYVPSNPGQVDTTTITKTVNISQTFNPDCAASDPDSGACTGYTSKTIKDIKQEIGNNKFTNWAFADIQTHLVDFVKNPLASTDDRMTAFKSYDSNSTLGSGNFTNRGLSVVEFQCQLSRKIDQVADFINNKNATTIDEQIPGTNYRFSEVILALDGMSPENLEKGIGTPYFYYKSCESGAEPSRLTDYARTAFASVKKNTPSDPVTLYLNAISPGSQCSVATLVTQCDINANNNTKTCKPPENQSIPRGCAGISAGKVMANIISAADSPKEQDYSQTTNNGPIPDKPNSLSWLAVWIKDLWDGEFPTSQTWQGPTELTFQIDKNVTHGIDVDNDAMTRLIPKDDYAKSGIDSANASTTNQDMSVDVGYRDNLTRQLLYQSLTPCADQPNCQM